MKSYKVKLNIKSNALKSLFKKMSGLYRKIYNLSLELQYYRFVVNRKNKYIGYNSLRKVMDVCKDEQFPFLKEVDGGVYYAAIATATNAFKYAFNYHVDTIPYLSRKKDIMKFKTKGNIRIYNDCLILPKIGKVKLQEKGRIPLGKKYHNITFTNEGDGWFVSLEVEEEHIKPELTGAPVSLDFTKDGDILLNNSLINSPTKSKNYQKVQRRFKKLSKKLRRQTKANLKKVSPTRSVPVTTRNMKKTKGILDKLKKILYNVCNDAYKKLVCDVARTKPREIRILSNSSVRQTRNGYLTRKMREADSRSLLNMMRKKMGLIGADVHLLASPISLGSGDHICGGYSEYCSNTKTGPVNQISATAEEQKKTQMGNQETNCSN